MNRYFFYLVIIFTLSNTMVHVPRILLVHQFDGSVLAILLSAPISAVLSYLFCTTIRKFPGWGVPEIMQAQLPSWIRLPFLSAFSLIWFAGGAIALFTFARITNRFINPEMSATVILTLLILVTIWGTIQSTKTILYFSEMMIIIVLPMAAFILFKAFSSEEFDWNAVRVSTHYIWKLPSWTSLSAATYVYTGYIQFALFNRAFSENKPIKHIWAVTAAGFIVSLTTTFIPIGLSGTFAVQDYMYPWVNVADSLRMKYGFVERVIFLYLVIYLVITLLMASISWHLAAEFLKSCLPRQKPNIEKINTLRTSAIICICFGAITIGYGMINNEKQSLHHAEIWLNLRFFSTVALVAFIYFLGLRRQKK